MNFNGSRFIPFTCTWIVLVISAYCSDVYSQIPQDEVCPLNGEKVFPGSAAHYTEQAVRLYPDGSWVSGGNEVAGSWGLAESDALFLMDVACVLAKPDSSFIYAIEAIKMSNAGEQKALIIYRRQASVYLRDLEFVVPQGDGEVDPGDLQIAREKWMKLCNQHNASELVNTMYTQDAMYYNHKPVIQGRAAITKEYDYMNRENYSLQLQPLVIHSVSGSMAFEIGQCSGSYGGKYMLVWELCEDREWRVLMDSNI